MSNGLGLTALGPGLDTARSGRSPAADARPEPGCRSGARGCQPEASAGDENDEEEEESDDANGTSTGDDEGQPRPTHAGTAGSVGNRLRGWE